MDEEIVLECQRDEFNGNVWPWQSTELFILIRRLFEANPLMTELTMSFDNVDMRFRKKRD